MSKKMGTDSTGQHNFINWAIAIVAALVGVMIIATIALVVMMVVDAPVLETVMVRQSAPPTVPQPTIPVWETATPPMGLRPSFPAAVPATPVPLATATVLIVVVTDEVETAVFPPSNSTVYAHPTYQPTTEPCAACHDAEMKTP